MKILRLEAENVKKLRAVEIVPDGSLVQITGPNGSGKSSVLDAIYMALAGTKAIPSKPVRAGADKARITLDLGEVIVTRRFTAAGGTTIVVEAANGARFPSPQKMLDDLLGALTFDPLAFSRMEPRKQLETLRGLVTIDVDIDELDRLNARDYDERTEANRKAKTLRVQAEGIKADPTAPHEPVDVSELTAQMERAGEHNADIERRRANRDAAATKISEERGIAERSAKRAAELREAAEQLERDAVAAERRADGLQAKIDAAGDLPAPVDTAEIRARIDQAAATNAAVERNIRRRSLEAQAAEAEQESAALTERMEERKRQRAEAIASAAMPVEGLSFGDGEVIYNGLPFDQASSAEQLRVSVAIAMAANPKLRVLRIKDGSLLDENGLRLVGEMAEAADYQVWIEQVDTSGKVGIVMEDGAVRGANDNAEPAQDGAA
ncbi:MAG TPA: AAA family ATPase [Pseudoxanthomonas sp.]